MVGKLAQLFTRFSLSQAPLWWLPRSERRAQASHGHPTPTTLELCNRVLSAGTPPTPTAANISDPIGNVRFICVVLCCPCPFRVPVLEHRVNCTVPLLQDRTATGLHSEVLDRNKLHIRIQGKEGGALLNFIMNFINF